MIVDGDREHLLGVVLADDVVVEDLADLFWGRDTVTRFRQRGRLLLTDYVHAQFDALVADEDRRSGNELTHLALALAAERAVERVLRIAVADLTHFRGPTRCESSPVTPQDKPGASTILFPEGRPAGGSVAVGRAIGTPTALARQAGAIAARSGNERIAFLLVRFDHSARRSRQLKHGRVLAFAQPGEQNDLSIRKFQRVVVRRRLFLID